MRVRTRRFGGLGRLPESMESKAIEVTYGQCAIEGFRVAEPPRAFATGCEHCGFLPMNTALQEGGPTFPKRLPLCPLVRPETPSNPSVQTPQHLVYFAVAKIAPPAVEVPVQLLKNVLQVPASRSARDLPDSFLESKFRRQRYATPRGLFRGETEPEELSLLRPGHRTFVLVDPEPQLCADESPYALHHSLSCSFASHVDIAIIRVAGELVASLFQLLIELVKHDVRQQGRERSSLRGT